MLLLCVWTSGCTAVETATETATLPNGAVLTNTTYVIVEDQRIRHNELFYRETPSASREPVAHIIDIHGGPPISLSDPVPRIHHAEGRTTIALERHAFQRWPRREGPFWHHKDTKPDGEASVFLRSLLNAGDPDLADAPRQFEGGSYDVSQSSADYVVDRFDSDRNALIVRRSNGFPRYLAYRAGRYGFPWRFDSRADPKSWESDRPIGAGPDRRRLGDCVSGQLPGFHRERADSGTTRRKGGLCNVHTRLLVGVVERRVPRGRSERHPGDAFRTHGRVQRPPAGLCGPCSGAASLY